MRYVNNVTFKYCIEYSKNVKEMEDFFFTVRGIKSFLATEKPENSNIFVWDDKKAIWKPFKIIEDFKPKKSKKKRIEDGYIIDNVTNFIGEHLK